ncbi:flagellar assembly protein FliH [Deefgea rivuli]|uniref:flagellar assembly protein FliH n=1 Tax=Deefgea rivuli TaxID=400948 RepID=UPI0004898BAF|nr:flagellar assembly protein FliH [Deefgea rivuli]
MSGPHRRVIPREELSEFQRWQFNSLLDTPAAAHSPAIPEIEQLNAGAELAPAVEHVHQEETQLVETEIGLPDEPAMPYPTAEEIEAIQQQAHDEGFQAGLEAGRLAAEAEVLQLQALLASVTDTLQAAESQLAESVLDLGLLVARQMICDELQSQPRQLLAPIREALAVMPTPVHPSRLYLSPDDLELLQSALHIELPSDVWRLLPDPNMASGSCKIETPATQLSYTLASRWENILKVLKRSHHPDLAWGKYPDIASMEAQSSATVATDTPMSAPFAADNDAID